MTPSTEFEQRGAETGTWVRPPQTTEKRVSGQAKLKDWTPRRPGALLGFCSVQLASGMILNDLRGMTRKNGFWVAMQAQKQIEHEGKPRLDASGKPLFSQIIEFRDRRSRDPFNALIIGALRRRHPSSSMGRRSNER